MSAGEEDAVGGTPFPVSTDSDCRLCGFTEPKINAPATRVAGATASV